MEAALPKPLNCITPEKQSSSTKNAFGHGPCPELVSASQNHDRDPSDLSLSDWLSCLENVP